MHISRLAQDNLIIYITVLCLVRVFKAYIKAELPNTLVQFIQQSKIVSTSILSSNHLVWQQADCISKVSLSSFKNSTMGKILKCYQNFKQFDNHILQCKMFSLLKVKNFMSFVPGQSFFRGLCILYTVVIYEHFVSSLFRNSVNRVCIK